MNRFALPLFILLVLTLAACAPEGAVTQQAAPTVPVSNAVATPTDDPAILATLFPNTSSGDLTRMDDQGAVVVEVTPLNLDAASDTLEFDVSMNTHSVDLSMDLASLATLTTDIGLTIQPTKWDATPGGHHVPGKLIFPATQNGKSVLDGAGKLTLTIVNVDAPTRVFEWSLQ
jgi:hypothetical protein